LICRYEINMMPNLGKEHSINGNRHRRQVRVAVCPFAYGFAFKRFAIRFVTCLTFLTWCRTLVCILMFGIPYSLSLLSWVRGRIREYRVLRTRAILNRNPPNPKPNPHLKIRVSDSSSRILKSRCRLCGSDATHPKGEEWIRSMWEAVDWNHLKERNPSSKTWESVHGKTPKIS